MAQGGNNHNQNGNGEPKPEPGGAAHVMGFALIDQAERLGRSTERAQQALTAQIGKLVELRGEIAAAVQNLEAERGRLQGVGPLLQQNAAHAMRLTLQEQGEMIGTKMSSALDRTVQHLERAGGQIERAAGHVRQNVRETNWLMICLYFVSGMLATLLLVYLPLRGDINGLREQGDRIEQYLAAQQKQQQPAPAPEPPRAPAHKAKAKQTQSP